MHYFHKVKFLLIGLFSIACLVSIVWLGSIYFQLNRPMIQINQTPVIFQFDKFSTAWNFANQLYKKKLIKSQKVLLDYMRWQGLQSKLKAGIYAIKPGESVISFVKRVISGDVLQQTFRIIEGTNFYQVEENLRRAPYLKYYPNNWTIISNFSLNPEGMLLADSYVYDAGSDGKSVLKHAHENLRQFLQQVWESRSVNLPYKNSYELLIAASILEKETGIPTERKLISGVIVNRLKKNMPLQVDPTIIYALGPNFKGKLTHQDMLFDSPYNTYRYRGLPPSPIAMVGKDAILAAAHPESHNYLYFVAKGDGSHHFSTNYEEQKKAIDRFLRKRYEYRER